MRSLRKTALLIALCLLLHLSVSAVDSISLKPAGLSNRCYLVLGDSYTAGYGLDSIEQDWSFLMAENFGMEQLNFSINGSTMAAGPTERFPMATRAELLPEDVSPDFILLQGGSNDWSRSIPLGSDDDTDPTTFCGAVNYLIDLLGEKYPDAAIVGFTPWISDSTQNRVNCVQQDYTDAMLRIFEARGLPCYNASDNTRNGMHLEQREFRTDYCLTPGDWYHLNAEGHAMFAPIISAWLTENLYPLRVADQIYDLAYLPEKTQNTVMGLVARRILPTTSAHLFSPTRGSTRGELAMALYVLAGYPEAEDRALTDIPAESPLYPAVCWAMETGICSPADSFAPSRVVTREMLAAAMYRYYTEYSGGFPNTMMGLGTYPDGSAVSDYARTAMGWALSSGVMETMDGYLRPKATVSRVQLALALNALWWLS